MVRAQLRAVLEDSTRGDVIVEAEGGNVRSAVNALFDEQPPSIEWLAQFHPEVVGINIELTLETAEARAIRVLRANGMDARLHHTGGAPSSLVSTRTWTGRDGSSHSPAPARQMTCQLMSGEGFWSALIDRPLRD